MRLELTRRGDYAVRAMIALAAMDGTRPVSARRIAERMDIPVRFLPHVLSDLVRAGLIIGTTGRAGGYRLAVAAGELDLLRIVDAVEDDGGVARCVLRGGPCGLDGRCAVHEAFSAASEAMRAQLRGTSLSTVAARGDRIDPAVATSR